MFVSNKAWAFLYAHSAAIELQLTCRLFITDKVSRRNKKSKSRDNPAAVRGNGRGGRGIACKGPGTHPPAVCVYYDFNVKTDQYRPGM